MLIMVDLTSEDDDDAAFSVPGHPITRPSLVGSGLSRSSLTIVIQPHIESF